ncbi:MAG: hypothetical protein Q7S85_08535 [Rugosibacter sp.]|nr:hypothetical protein [Rugosibacter sp.]
MKRLVENLPLTGIVTGATYGPSSPPQQVQLSKGKIRVALATAYTLSHGAKSCPESLA